MDGYENINCGFSFSCFFLSLEQLVFQDDGIEISY